MRRIRRDKQRIAVGRRILDCGGRDLRRSTRTVIDNERLVENLSQLFGEEPRDDVRAASRTETDDDLDGPGRIVVLRLHR